MTEMKLLGKIREAEKARFFMLIIGEKETKMDNVSVRKHRVGDIGLMGRKLR